ncbi:MAG: ABC transporter permease [Pseudonocardia sp. SCN 72-86]|nr:MAG: ABC transporter permease [Pseudonocardia sp. SCN 72-86]
MLVWTRGGRAAVVTVFALVVAVVVALPLLTVLVAGLASEWNGVLSSGLGGARLADALAQDNQASLLVSVQTALVAGVVAVVVGGWAAIAAPDAPGWLRRITTAVFALPVAVPSVVVGLGVLIAFSRPPFVLNGTLWIVVLVHSVLVVAFAYATVGAGLARLDPVYAQAADSLGASPLRILLTVRLPMLLPAFTAAFGLSFALSMGELGATIMVYPPGWRTLPVTIFALSDRGAALQAAANTVVLLTATLVVSLLVGRIRGRAALR